MKPSTFRTGLQHKQLIVYELYRLKSSFDILTMNHYSCSFQGLEALILYFSSFPIQLDLLELNSLGTNCLRMILLFYWHFINCSLKQGYHFHWIIL